MSRSTPARAFRGRLFHRPPFFLREAHVARRVAHVPLAARSLFLLPLGIRAGGEVSVMDAIVKNVIPVTLGNIIAGAVIFAASYSFLYGKLGGHSKD